MQAQSFGTSFCLSVMLALLQFVGLAPATAAVFEQNGSDGVVSIEAEQFDSRTSRNGQSWRSASFSGSSGGSAMQALPNIQTNIDTGYVTSSPRLDYKVVFRRTGKHYVWIRGYGSSSRDDSLHVGLNGQAQQSADGITGFSGYFRWSHKTMDGVRATINVTRTGEQTLNVWMREDGMSFDKIVLTTNQSLDPYDYGVFGPPTSDTVDSGGSGNDGSGGSSEPPASSSTLISFEAEAFESRVARNGHEWRQVSVAASSGGSAVKSLPDTEVNYDSGYVSLSPRLDYTVNFNEAGNYYIWVRGVGSSSKDDSLHIGLNGQAEARADRISGFAKYMSWSNETMDGPPAMLQVQQAGVQTLNVWMREDGMVIDKIVLTRDSSLDPADYGAQGPASNQPASSSGGSGSGDGGSSSGEGGSGTSNTPPVVSGTPQKTVVADDEYDFRPSVSDADGDTVSWSILRQPGWASFSSATGRLRGKPSAADVGQYRDIVMTASDGQGASSLEPFTITVVAAGNASLTLSWTPPTRNTDGSLLRDLAGYELRWGPSDGAFNQSRRVNNPGLTSYVVENLEAGEYKFVVLAINSAGVKSAPSRTAFGAP
jgi:hypothetical protein